MQRVKGDNPAVLFKEHALEQRTKCRVPFDNWLPLTHIKFCHSMEMLDKRLQVLASSLEYVTTVQPEMPA